MEELKYPEEIEEIRKLGFEPYAYKFERNTVISEIREKYNKLKPDQKKDKIKLRIAGRIRSTRGHGKLHFIDLEDFSGRIQLYIEDKNLKGKESKPAPTMIPKKRKSKSAVADNPC